MKAIVQDVYGPPMDVLRFEEVADPAVGPTDVLVAVGAVGLNAADWRLAVGEPLLTRLGFGLRRPKRRTPGSDVAGTVRSVGAQVTGFAVGDAVVGIPRGGGLAELVAVPQDRLVHRPAAVDVVTAAAIPLSGATALHAVREVVQVRDDQRVLVTGASGGVGSAAVQLAVAAGAHVTGVCRTDAVDLVRGLGAAAVIDRTREPVPGDGPYDVIVHVAGGASLRDLRRALAPDGTLVLVGGDGGRVLGPVPGLARAAVANLGTRQQLRPLIAPERAEDVTTLLGLAAEGVLRPPVERTFALAEGAAAVEHLRTGRTLGKVVVVL